MVALNRLLRQELASMGHEATVETYLGMMNVAFERDPPPFGNAWYGDSYRQCAANPYWLIQSLISNSIKEGLGARDLWDLAPHIADNRLRSLVEKHARDEGRHARQYIAVLHYVFPDSLSVAQTREILDAAPIFPKHNLQVAEIYDDDRILDLIIQINLGEFRTRLHQLLMMPVLMAICSQRDTKGLQSVMKRIADDEIFHLAYTAQHINSSAMLPERKERIEELIERRVAQFNALTIMELGTQSFAA